MREIKFRAWDKACGEWIYGEPLYGLFPSVHGLDKSEEEYAASGHYSDVQMCSGLKDKNGKEIYEGDVIRYVKELRTNSGKPTGKSINHDYEVYFERGGWRMKKIGSTSAVYALCGKSEHHEIIGNIYENPELLQTLTNK